VVPVDWFAVIFNPSFPTVCCICRWRLSQQRAVRRRIGGLASAARQQHARVRAMFSMALWMTLIVAPVQAMIGDMHGLNTLKHQPAKIAAIEGHWENPRRTHPAAAVRLAGYGAGAHPLWSGDPGPRQPDPHPQPG
jgi:cytochrome d ubiquinol oxidase subunit I